MRAFYLAAVLVLLSGLLSSAQSAAPAAPPDDEHPTLPAGTGRAVMIRVCSQCHAPENVVDQQLDLDGWKSLVDQMASKGAEATDAEFEDIVRYLATAFPAAR